MKLALLALLPAILLCAYIYVKDRNEKEPFGLLLTLFISGVLSCFPAIFIENFLSSIPMTLKAHAFGVVALTEEGCKWTFMYFSTRRSPHFNSLFDGIVYAVFVSLGFAAFENLLYVMGNGVNIGVVRAVLSVPGHFFTAVLMGCYYSLWHVYEKAGLYEMQYRIEGIIDFRSPEISGRRYLLLSILIPVLVHGFFDYCLMRGSVLYTLIFLAFVVFLYVFCFRRVRKMSREDAYDTDIAERILLSKYPDLYTKIYKPETEY